MFCNKCGNKLVDGAKFCEYCGSPVKQGTQQQIQSAPEQQQVQNVPQTSLEYSDTSGNTGKKGGKTAMIIGIIAGAAVLIGIVIAVVLMAIGKKDTGVAEETTEEVAEVTTEATTVATTEATTEEEVVIPYAEEYGLTFDDPTATFSVGKYVFNVSEAGKFFDRIEPDDYTIVQHDTENTLYSATTTDADEEGYEYTIIEIKDHDPYEMYWNGTDYPYMSYTQSFSIYDYNTGILCNSNSLDIGVVDKGEITDYEEVASEGDAVTRDLTFFKENMKFTDIEYDGETYQIGCVYQCITDSSSDWEKGEVTEKGTQYTRYKDDTITYVIYAPKDTRLMIAIYKDGVTKEVYEKDLEQHNENLAKAASETDSEEDESDEDSKKITRLFDDKSDGTKQKAEDFYIFDVEELLSTFN